MPWTAEERQGKRAKLAAALDHLERKGSFSSLARTPTHSATRQLLTYGQHLRDVDMWREPTLAGAVSIYGQLASSRDWTVSGPERPAARALEFLQNTRSVDLTTGLFTLGLEEFERRRAYDHIAVGRKAFLNRAVPGETYTRLEYLDPCLLTFVRERSLQTEVKASERVWQYSGNTGYQENFRFDQVFLSHPQPIGTKGLFMAPLAPIVPALALAYLVTEHDTASLDGRRIRDIVLVQNENMADALTDAILTQVAMWAGETDEKLIPITALNSPSGMKISDLIMLLSLSKLPEDFDREQFIFAYVNQIAALLGLALRQFWNNERTTNKALEQIQEQRQQRKGPELFVQDEQRLINRSGILRQFGLKVRMGFVEEIDNQSQLINSQVLKTTMEALVQLRTVLGLALSNESVLAWMQSIQVIPANVRLVEGIQPTEVQTSTDQTSNITPGEAVLPSDPPPSPAPKEPSKSAPLSYDEVTFNSKGEIVDRRRKLYPTTVVELLTQTEQAQQAKEAADPDLAQSFSDVIRDEEQRLSKQFLAMTSDQIDPAFAKLFFTDEEIEAAVERAHEGTLLPGDYSILNSLLTEPVAQTEDPNDDSSD